MRIGVDTGGTFTDVVLIDDRSSQWWLCKLPSTPGDPSIAIVDGIREIISQSDVDRDGVAVIEHGTTVATNAIIEHKVPPSGMVTTRGFRDILELARQRRPDVFDLDIPKPQPFAPRDLRKEVTERTTFDGGVLAELDAAEVESAIDELVAAGVASTAICLIHSYANAAHEQAIKEVIRRREPRMFVCASSDVLPEFREYERFSATMLNAALLPIMATYLRKLESRIKSANLSVTLHVMQSNGGLMGVEAAAERPISTVFSGPSAGVVGAARVAQTAGYKDIVTFDMGGTSTDVCLVNEGNLTVTSERIVAGWPVKFPSVDLHSVGAGGGSIGAVDIGGFLTVGPSSAGANPGPACYARGGDQATVTDAHVILGRLNQGQLLAGRLPLNGELASQAMALRVGQPLGVDAVSAAQRMIRIVNAHMSAAIRVISVKRGYDPRDFTLVAFGGAGPLHAAELAKDLGMHRVLIPRNPGLLCAMGLLMAELRADFGRTFVTPCSSPDIEGLASIYQILEAQAAEWLVREGVEPSDAILVYSADMRYVGQDYELPVQGGSAIDLPAITELVGRFHREHKRIHGYANTHAEVEIVAARVVAHAGGAQPSITPEETNTQRGDPHIGDRLIYFTDTKEPLDTPVYDRALLDAGQSLAGPAVIEQMDSTTLVLPGQEADVDTYGNIVIRNGTD